MPNVLGDAFGGSSHGSMDHLQHQKLFLCELWGVDSG
jgi:hypothetical protein